MAGRQDEALDCYHQALTLVEQIEERWVDSCARAHLGTFYRQLGRYPESLDQHRQALRLKREIGDRGAESDLLCDLGETHLAEGRTDQALAMYEQALAHAVGILDNQQQARAHDGLAKVLRGKDPVASGAHWRRALEIYGELGVPEAEHVRRQLDALAAR